MAERAVTPATRDAAIAALYTTWSNTVATLQGKMFKDDRAIAQASTYKDTLDKWKARGMTMVSGSGLTATGPTQGWLNAGKVYNDYLQGLANTSPLWDTLSITWETIKDAPKATAQTVAKVSQKVEKIAEVAGDTAEKIVSPMGVFVILGLAVVGVILYMKVK
jgi:hypothetical protein